MKSIKDLTTRSRKIPSRSGSSAKVSNVKIGNTLYSQGLSLMRSGFFKEATLKLRTAANKNPQNADIWYHLGIAFRRSGNAKNALKSFNQALYLNKENPVYWYAKANTFYIMGDRKNALEAYAILENRNKSTH